MIKNIEKYCPNMFYNKKNISIGEFKTFDNYQNFPLQIIWENKINKKTFDYYKKNNYKILIICNSNKINSQRFILGILNNKFQKYFDSNDLPMDLIINDYKKELGKDAINAINNLFK